jgi:hypothetical protein
VFRITNTSAPAIVMSTSGDAGPYVPYYDGSGVPHFFAASQTYTGQWRTYALEVNFQVHTFKSSGGPLSWLMNQASQSNEADTPTPYTGNFNALGARTFDNLLPAGSFDLAEIIFCNASLSGTDQANLEKYLGVTYGISIPSGSAVDPSTIASLQGWWKADSLWTPTLLADGDPVSTWPDYSGNGFHATKVGTPILKKNIVGGKPVVRITSNDGFTFAGFPAYLPVTYFGVFKRASASQSMLALMSDTNWGFGMAGDGVLRFGTTYWIGKISGWTDPATGFHVFTAKGQDTANAFMYIDGTYYPNGADVTPTSDLIRRIGYFQAGNSSDGDIVELIAYTGSLALQRLKKALLLGGLITTGDLPSPESEEAPEPMAVGDRANIEAYLGTKYGIAVTSGGTPVDPATIPGLLAWWKADSLEIPTTTVIDVSYAGAGYSGAGQVNIGAGAAAGGCPYGEGNAFTSTGGTLDHVVFPMYFGAAAPGKFIYAKLWAVSPAIFREAEAKPVPGEPEVNPLPGRDGVTVMALPGTLLATSDPFPYPGIVGGFNPKLTFSGSQRYHMVAGTSYIISFEFNSGVDGNGIVVSWYYGVTGVNYPGNMVEQGYNGGVPGGPYTIHGGDHVLPFEVWVVKP